MTPPKRRGLFYAVGREAHGQRNAESVPLPRGGLAAPRERKPAFGGLPRAIRALLRTPTRLSGAGNRHTRSAREQAPHRGFLNPRFIPHPANAAKAMPFLPERCGAHARAPLRDALYTAAAAKPQPPACAPTYPKSNPPKRPQPFRGFTQIHLYSAPIKSYAKNRV